MASQVPAPVAVIPEYQPFTNLAASLPELLSQWLKAGDCELKIIQDELILGKSASQSSILFLSCLLQNNADLSKRVDSLDSKLESLLTVNRNMSLQLSSLQFPQPPKQKSANKAPKPPTYANAAKNPAPPQKKHRDYAGRPVSERSDAWASDQLFCDATLRTWGRWYQEGPNGPFFQSHPDQKAAAALAGRPSPFDSTAPPPPTPRTKKQPKRATALPGALRRFFSTRSSPSPIADSKKWAASLPISLAALLESQQAKVSLALNCTINDIGTITITTSASQPATDFLPFMKLLTDHLNDTLPVEYNHYKDFKLAPTTVDFAIHALPLHILPLDPTELTVSMKQAIRYASEGSVDIISARYLISDPSKRTKNTSSVVISVSMEDAPTIPSSINLFSRSRKCERMVSSGPATQCRNCQEFGHIASRCK